MQTIYLENKGDKGFQLHQLPVEAQYSPVYGITSTDANHDGKEDILLCGNNAWTRIKFGRYEANHGVLLAGDGKNNFTYTPQYKSGLNIKGDVRSLVKVKGKNTIQLLAGINDSPVVGIKTR